MHSGKDLESEVLVEEKARGSKSQRLKVHYGVEGGKQGDKINHFEPGSENVFASVYRSKPKINLSLASL